MTSTPAGLGFAMPAEWERHEATWLAWPHRASDWPGKFAMIPWIYGEMVRKISTNEIVRMLVRHRAEEKLARNVLKRSGCDLRKVDFIVCPTNRGWMRDSGPVFVKKGRSGSPSPAGRRAWTDAPGQKSDTAIVHFHFNGWGNKYGDWQKDARIPETAAKLFRKKLFHASCFAPVSFGTPSRVLRNFTIEGGGIEVNGRGTLLLTEECYLHPRIQVRNPGLSKQEIEATLENYLGVTNIFWLGKGIVGDDTHGHIDDLCRFVDRKTLVLMQERNSRDANYRSLAENRERICDVRLEDGSKPEIVALPMPAPLYFDGRRLPASYANFYICNAAVIVPTFNDANDRLALGILGDLFKGRPVEGIHAVDLVLGLGTLHCLTQQQPASL